MSLTVGYGPNLRCGSRQHAILIDNRAREFTVIIRQITERTQPFIQQAQIAPKLDPIRHLFLPRNQLFNIPHRIAVKAPNFRNHRTEHSSLKLKQKLANQHVTIHVTENLLVSVG